MIEQVSPTPEKRGSRKPLINRVGITSKYLTMKKSLKNLQLKKEVVNNLNTKGIKGGAITDGPRCEDTYWCPTNGPLNTCPPPGMQCY